MSDGSTHSLSPEPADSPAYLRPYLGAARRHGGGFGSLLWANPFTQEARFDAFTRVCDFAGRSVLDVGCGRADLLDFLLARGVVPADYAGVEAVAPLADAAEAKLAADPLWRPVAGRCRILRGDFVAEPGVLGVGADLVVFSGSLNTLAPDAFRATLGRAYEAARVALVFNFLDSSHLAGNTYLHWHPPGDVLRFARALGGEVCELAGYLEGDRTVAVRQPGRRAPARSAGDPPSAKATDPPARAKDGTQPRAET